jgi:segregation and condensation protein B
MTEPQSQAALQRTLEPLSANERVRATGAMLFVTIEPVSVVTVAHHLGCTLDEAYLALGDLSAALPTVGLVLQWVSEELVQLGTAPDLATVLRKFSGQERTVRLSQAALETLALVSYRQPVTRADLESIRGVDTTGVLQTLLARNLIEPVGRLTTVGSPVLYATTAEFLRLFGLTSLADLPPLPSDFVARIDDRIESTASG